MLVISNEATSTFPAIEAVGEDEPSACALYAVLYNTELLSHRDDNGKLTNAWGGTVYTSYLTLDWQGFAELAEHMREVHEVELTAKLA